MRKWISEIKTCKIYILAFVGVLSNPILCAQVSVDHDPKAKVILDDLSKTTKAFKSISAEYEQIILNKEKKEVDKQSGKIFLKGAKFRLEIPGNVIVSDGKTVWTHNKDAQEVTIRNYESSEEDALDPTKIFTLYETGFKYAYEKEEKIGNENLTVINLYPSVKPEKKKYHTIKLYVDKSKKIIRKIKIMNKDGGVISIEVKDMKTNQDLPDSFFSFDTKGFKADQIIDERDGK